MFNGALTLYFFPSYLAYIKSDVLCDILLNDFVEYNSKKDDAIDIFPYVQRCALDMILETAMGTELDIQNNRQSNYSHCIQRIVRIFLQRQLFPWYQVST